MTRLVVLIFSKRWSWFVLGGVLIAIAVAVFATAHPAKPIALSGTITSYKEYTTSSGNYDRNELQLTGDSRTFFVTKTDFHPALPESVFRNGKVDIWYDDGSTRVLALSLYDENDANPTKYTTDVYDHPDREISNAQGFSYILGGIGLVPLLIGFLFPLMPWNKKKVAAPVTTQTTTP